MTPTAGVGLTWGRYKSGTNFTQTAFVLIPRGASTAAEFGRRSSTANQWVSLTGPGFKVDHRPGLAYRPFKDGTNAADVQIGRFWFIARNPSESRTPPYVWITEGNDTTGGATTQRLSVWKGGYYYDQWDYGSVGSYALLYDPARDTNMRGAFMSPNNELIFQPIADGAVNATFRDQNDYSMLTKNLACSFNGTKCYECTSLAADGTCATWLKQ